MTKFPYLIILHPTQKDKPPLLTDINRSKQKLLDTALANITTEYRSRQILPCPISSR